MWCTNLCSDADDGTCDDGGGGHDGSEPRRRELRTTLAEAGEAYDPEAVADAKAALGSLNEEHHTTHATILYQWHDIGRYEAELSGQMVKSYLTKLRKGTVQGPAKDSKGHAQPRTRFVGGSILRRCVGTNETMVTTNGS